MLFTRGSFHLQTHLLLINFLTYTPHYSLTGWLIMNCSICYMICMYLSLKIILGRAKIGEIRDSAEVSAPITNFSHKFISISNEFVSNAFFFSPIIR